MKHVLLLFALFALIACSTTYYTHPNPNADWEMDSAQCEAYSMGNAPMPSPAPTALGYSVAGSGMIGNSTYSYSGIATPDPYANLQTSVNNFNATLGALAAQQRLYELCLKRLGWKESDTPPSGPSAGKADR